ncbi:MAG: YdcF family protein [Cyclobacteriaceae bacterium]|nr:YdcF family protein [Cyclobacteriaceae bacterium]
MKRFIIFSIVLIVLSHLFYSCAVSKANKAFHKNIANTPYDVVIVPGFPYQDSDTIWHDVMKMRVYWSQYLYENNYTRNIIYSGSAVYSPYIESEVMKLHAIAIGLPSGVIYTETRAEHSTENLYYSYQLAKKMGFEKIALATDPFQTSMLTSFARRKKIKVDYLPVVLDTLKTISKVNPNIDLSSTKMENFVSITERESTWKRWMGTLGKNIVEVQ